MYKFIEEMVSSIKENKVSLIIKLLLSIAIVWFPIVVMLPHLESVHIKACILFAILYTCTILLAQGKWGIFYLILSAILIECVNICELGWATMNGSVLFGDSLWVVFDTNQDEAFGFFKTVPLKTYLIVPSQLLSIMVLITLFIRCHRRRQTHEISKKNRIVNIILFSVFGLCTLTPMMRRKCPYSNFYNSYYKYEKDKREVAEFYKNRQNVVIDAKCYYPNIDKTIVFIIGESANRHHYGIYGYPRNTTPHLDSIADELIIYSDVVSPARATLSCMKQILTFANYTAPDLYKKEASIIEILKGAGYKTYWLDNQGMDSKDEYTPSSYRTIASMSDYYHVIPKVTFDEELFPFYEQCLQDSALNKAIFIHLIGSHFPYDKDAPQTYWVFNDTIGIVSPYKEKLTSGNIADINMYDNTVLYNDYIITSLINRLRNSNKAIAVLTLSDHGEEMCETYHFCGRSKEKLSRCQCEIPFILWMNQTYKENIPLNIDTSRSFCSDDVIYAIMDMAGVKYTLKDTTKSIFSNAFIPKKREVEGVLYEDLPRWE